MLSISISLHPRILALSRKHTHTPRSRLLLPLRPWDWGYLYVLGSHCRCKVSGLGFRGLRGAGQIERSYLRRVSHLVSVACHWGSQEKEVNCFPSLSLHSSLPLFLPVGIPLSLHDCLHPCLQVGSRSKLEAARNRHSQEIRVCVFIGMALYIKTQEESRLASYSNGRVGTPASNTLQ